MLSILTNTSMSFPQKMMYILIIGFCVLLSLSVHEACHGLGAYILGDKTAKTTGRLSLNPFHHLDPFGALCLFLFGFGWAKPVLVNPRNFKHPKAGMAFTAVSGPLSNFILAFLAEVGMQILGGMTFSSESSVAFNIASVTYIICMYLAMINLGLGLFNLIPIPPLDGSKVLGAILPRSLYFKLMQYERYGFILLIILINTPVFSSFLNSARNIVLNFYDTIIALIF